MTEDPSISVIIPNYNGKHHLNDCLISLKNQLYKNFEVIVVDNASTDGSVDFINNNFPEFRVVVNSENAGFSKAVNQAAKLSDLEYIVILNNDTIVDKYWLEEFVSFSKKFKDFGSCQSKVLLYNDIHLLNTVGNEIFFLGHGWSGGYRKPDEHFNNIREVNYCSGAALFIRRDVLKRIGFFDDEEVLMYHDDLDLGWRLLLYGYKNYLVPNSVIYHKYEYNRNPKKYYYIEVSRLICIIKYYEIRTILLLLPALFAMEFGIICYSMKGGWFMDKMKSYSYIIKNITRLYKKRMLVQRSRILSDKEILKQFKSEIDFVEINNVFIYLVNPIMKIYWKLVLQIL